MYVVLQRNITKQVVAGSNFHGDVCQEKKLSRIYIMLSYFNSPHTLPVL